MKIIKADQKKYIEMNLMFQELIENLFNFFERSRYNLCSKLTALEFANNELKVIIDALYPEQTGLVTVSEDTDRHF
jgi:hypothetical protein